MAAGIAKWFSQTEQYKRRAPFGHRYVRLRRRRIKFVERSARSVGGMGRAVGSPADEFIVVKSKNLRGAVPAGLLRIVPKCRSEYFDAESSHELKNLAVDADCTPNPGWLRPWNAHIARSPSARSSAARRSILAATGSNGC